MQAVTRTASEMVALALELAQAEPARATELAVAALEDKNLPPIDRVNALWALGLGRRELDDLDGAASALRTAIDAGHESGEPALAAEVTSSLAWVMARMGDSEAALDLTDRAATHLQGAAAARNEMQRGLILQRLGRNRQALDSYALALAGLDPVEDGLAAARLRLNRSVIHVYSGALAEAIEDLEAAYRIGVDQNQVLLEAACAHNLGFTHGRRGDIPRSLSWFEIAEGIFADLGSRRRAITLRSDRSEVYADAGLMRNALSDAEAAVEDLRLEEEPPALADALLLLARIADLAADEELAATAAAEAGRLFAEQGRETWELHARYLETISTLRSSGERRHLDNALDLASRLGKEGWESEANRARIEAARLAFGNDDQEATIRILEPLEGRAPPSSDIDGVAHAEAMYMLDSARGRERESRQAIRRGLELLDRYRAGIGSPEIRAGIARHGSRLVAAAVTNALAAGDPWQVFQAVDTWRARSMDFPQALPPDDATLAAALSELRQVEGDLREVREAGGDSSELLTRRRQVEERIRKTARLAETGTETTGAARLRRPELTESLDGRPLVVYFARHGSIHAVWSDGRRWRVAEMGSERRIADDVDAAVFSLSRLAAARGSEASLAAADESLGDLGAQLSTTLVEALGIPDGPLVIVPTGALHRLPWNTLPALVGRPVSVAPSARAWMRAARRPPRFDSKGRVALVAGPDLDGARREVERLSRLYQGSNRLTGRNATVARVLSLLDGASVAHLGAHGTFRTDNPLFSSLRMADGPLTVYDLDRMASPPPIVVMPSCDTAVSGVGAGDELLGLAAALLGMGVSSLIAPTVPVPDSATRPLMISLHRRILAGATPAEALAETVTAGPGASPDERAARAGFVALGA